MPKIAPFYGRMCQAIRRFSSRQLPHSHRLVLLVLADYGERVFPGVETISEISGYGRSHLFRILKELEKAAWIHRERMPPMDGQRWGRTLYTLRLSGKPIVAIECDRRGDDAPSARIRKAISEPAQDDGDPQEPVIEDTETAPPSAEPEHASGGAWGPMGGTPDVHTGGLGGSVKSPDGGTASVPPIGLDEVHTGGLDLPSGISHRDLPIREPGPILANRLPCREGSGEGERGGRAGRESGEGPVQYPVAPAPPGRLFGWPDLPPVASTAKTSQNGHSVPANGSMKGETNDHRILRTDPLGDRRQIGMPCRLSERTTGTGGIDPQSNNDTSRQAASDISCTRMGHAAHDNSEQGQCIAIIGTGSGTHGEMSIVHGTGEQVAGDFVADRLGLANRDGAVQRFGADLQGADAPASGASARKPEADRSGDRGTGQLGLFGPVPEPARPAPRTKCRRAGCGHTAAKHTHGSGGVTWCSECALLAIEPRCAMFFDAGDIAPKGPRKAPATSARLYCEAFEAGVREAAPSQPFSLGGGQGAAGLIGRAAGVHAKNAAGPLTGSELLVWIRESARAFRLGTADRPEMWGGWSAFHWEKWLNMGSPMRQNGSRQQEPPGGLRIITRKLGDL